MPPITTIAPINRHRLILYSFVVIAPITTSNIPVTKMRQEMKACFCGLLFFIWSRSFVKFRVVELSILHKRTLQPYSSVSTASCSCFSFSSAIWTLFMSKKRFLSIILSVVMLLSLACSALAAEQSGRYIGDSTVNGSIYQTYYQVDAQTRTGIKSISVSGTLYEKGTFGTWQRVSNCLNTSTTSNCMASGNYNTKPGKSYKLEYSATFNYSDGRSETITGSTSR